MTTLTQKALAEICDISPRRISQLVKEGVITRNRQSRYELSAITQFIRYQRGNLEKPSDYRDLLEQEKYREKKRENDLAEGLLAPVEVIGEVVSRGVAAVIATLESLPLLMKRRFPELTGDQIQQIKAAVAECRNAMADVEVQLDD